MKRKPSFANLRTALTVPMTTPVPEAPVSDAGRLGGLRSRGGWATTIHALTDVVGRPYALMLTPGNVSDIKVAPTLLEHAGRMRYLLGEKGYDADSLRRSLREAGAIPVIPGRCNRKRTIRYDKRRYRGRHLVENAFCRLKDFRRIATRYGKLVANYFSAVALVTTVAFWLSMSLDPSVEPSAM